MMFCRLFILSVVTVLGLLCDRSFAQQSEAVALTEQEINNVFASTPILNELQIVNVNTSGPEVVADFGASWDIDVQGLSAGIRMGVAEFRGGLNFTPADEEYASALLPRTDANFRIAMSAPVRLNGIDYDGVASLWRWRGMRNGAEEVRDYVAIRILGEVNIGDFQNLLGQLGIDDVPMMDKVRRTAVRNPEFIIEVHTRDPLFYAEFEFVVESETQKVDFYFYKMYDDPALSAQTPWSLMFDFKSVQIKMQELADMVEREMNAAGFTVPFALFDPGRGQARDAAVILTNSNSTLSIDALDPIMRIPFERIYGGDDRMLTVHFQRGLNVVVKFMAGDFPNFYQYFEDLNIAQDLMMLVQGTLGWGNPNEISSGGGSKGKSDDKSQVRDHLQLGLYCMLTNYRFPNHLEEKGFAIADGAEVEFYIEQVPETLQMGVATRFQANLGGPERLRMFGGLQVVYTDEFVGLAMVGKMEDVWRAPGDIPFGMENVVVKFKVNEGASFAVGAKGTTHIGYRDSDGEKLILTSGNLLLQFVKVKVVVRGGAFTGAVNTVTVKDLVDLANMMYAIKEGTWQPWDVPQGPLMLGEIHNSELQDVFFQFCTPGAADADLGFAEEGFAARGTLLHDGEHLGAVLIQCTKQGVVIYGDARDFHFRDVTFEGAEIEIVNRSGEPQIYTVKAGLSVATERAAINMHYGPDSIYVEVELPRTLTETAKATPGKIYHDLKQLERVGKVAFKQGEIFAGEQLQMGGFVLNDARMWVEGLDDGIHLKLAGEQMIEGTGVRVEGEYIGDRNEFVLQAEAAGNLAFRDYQLAYASLSSYWTDFDNRSWVKALGRIGKDAKVDMEIELRGPGDAIGSGAVEINFPNGVTIGGQAHFEHTVDHTKLHLPVNPEPPLPSLNLPGFDLGDLGLGGVNLDGANFTGSNLEGVNFDGASLQGANLNGVNLSGASFAGANLSNAVVDAGTNFMNVTGLGDAIGVGSMVGTDLVTMGREFLEPHLDLGPPLDELANRAMQGAAEAMNALRDIQKQGYETVDKTVAISNWYLGHFNVNGHVHFSGTRNDVSMTVTGDVSYAGNTATFSGRADALTGDIVMTAEARSVNFRHVPFAHGGLTLKWNEMTTGEIRGVGTIGAGAQADIEVVITAPGDASGGGVVEISMNGQKINGEAHFTHTPEFTELKMPLPPNPQMPGWDLSGLDLRNLDLGGANLDGSNLTGGNFEGVNFGGASVQGANLNGGNFSGASFSGANLSNSAVDAMTNFEGVNLDGAVGVKSMPGIRDVTMGADLLKPFLGIDIEAFIERIMRGAAEAMSAMRDLNAQPDIGTVDRVVEVNWQIGHFFPTNGRVHLTGSAGAVSMAVSGDFDIAGSGISFSGSANPASGDISMTAEAGTIGFRHVPFAHGGLTLSWNEMTTGVIRGVGTIGSSVQADIEVEVRGANDASGGGNVTLRFGGHEVSGQAHFSHNENETRLDMPIAPGNSLRDWTFRDLDLRGLGFEGVDLTGADFTQAGMAGVDLKGVDLIGATLIGTDLTGANLESVNLEGANLDNATLESAVLNHANLRGVSAIGANFRGARLESAVLNHANLSGVYMEGVYFVNAWAVKSQLTNAKLMNTTLQGLDMSYSELRGANFTGASLRDASLKGCQVDPGALFEGVDFTNCNVDDVWGSGAPGNWPWGAPRTDPPPPPEGFPDPVPNYSPPSGSGPP